jgi:hypothetical protein
VDLDGRRADTAVLEQDTERPGALTLEQGGVRIDRDELARLSRET